MSRMTIILIVFVSIAGCGGGSFNRNLSFMDTSGGLPVTGLWRENIEAADLDMDGLPDLITPPPRRHYGEPPRIFLNKTTMWQETNALVMPNLNFDYGWIEAGPMAGGIYPALFINSHASALFALRGISPLSWENASPGLPTSFGGRALSLGDINNDGLLDIVSTMDFNTRGQKYTFIFIQTPEGWTQMEDNLPLDAFGPYIRLADFNNDGFLDIAMTLSTAAENYLYHGNGGKSWSPVTGNSLPRYVNSMDVADINADGYDDLLMLHSNKPAVFLGSKENLRELPANFPTGSYSTITAGFIDCDDQMDLVLGDSRSIEVYLQKRGSFEHALSIKTPSSTRFLKIRDMNKDGSEDIVALFPQPDAGGGIKVFANSARCANTRIKNISDGKTLKMGSLVTVEYISNKMETPYLKKDGELLPLKILLNEHGRTWVILPSVEEGQYELVLRDTAKRINLIK